MMYVRFPLSLRNVEDLLFERGIDICHETVRMWWNGFGPMFAGDIRRQPVSAMRGLRHWRWHLELGKAEKQEISRWANNRVENSHLPFRRRERAMLRFRRIKTLQKIANVHNHFNLERHLVDRQTFKQRRSAALAGW